MSMLSEKNSSQYRINLAYQSVGWFKKHCSPDGPYNYAGYIVHLIADHAVAVSEFT